MGATIFGRGGSRCSDNRYSDNRYSDNRAVGLGLISVFDHHGREQLGLSTLSTSSTKVFTPALMPTVRFTVGLMSNLRFQFSVTVRDRRVGYVDRQT